MAKKVLWNDGWEFVKGTLEQREIEDTKGLKWDKVDIPHDWHIYDVKKLYESSVGWYRKSFNHQIDDKLTIIRFDGIYMDSTIFINNQKVGEWKYGYSTFEMDITEYLVAGENEIKVRVIYEDPNSRWYAGAGIYRNVWLKRVSKLRLESDGVYITPIKQEKNWRVEIDTEIVTENKEPEWIKQTIFAPNGDKIAELKNTSLDVDGKKVMASCLDKAPSSVARASQMLYVSQALEVEAPLLWDIEQGNLYTLRTEIGEGQEIIDEIEQKFGFRILRFDGEEGFFINDRHVKINGVCEHHDFGALGAAFNKEAMRRKFNILREMGANALRTSHNMPAPEVMDLADEMGFLIVSEAFDMWELPKTTYDYARFFNEWLDRDVASWVRRDRNHPSIIMWSIGNEIYDTHADQQRGLEVTRILQEVTRKYDIKEHAPVTFGSNFLYWENTQNCADVLKYVGYNYAERIYDEHHKAHPDWIIYGSETASVLFSRGIYHFPLEKQILTDDDMQCSALGNSSTGWGSKSSEDNIIKDRDAKFSLGQFIWTGFDYIGESTPYETKNSYFGQIDTAGFPKDAYYIYQAEWTDYKKSPMVHIFPYWDFCEGQLIDLRVCSNAPRVELFVNGKSQGCFDIDHKEGKQLVAHWKLPYEKGYICAKAYDEEGKVIAEETRYSFGDAESIILKPNKTKLKADGRDLIFVEISTLDAQGHPVENAKNRMQVEVTGAGRLVGLDNGDSTDFDQYKGISRRLFSGKLMAIIAAKLEPGEIKVKVSSVGMKTEEITLGSVACEKVAKLSAIEENKKLPIVAGGPTGAFIKEDVQEVPIRKIEIVAPDSKALQFDADKRSISFKAICYPKNATYKDLEWRVITDTGIDSPLAKVESRGNEATITALGDGQFRVRCSAKNGGAIANVQAHLELSAKEIGEATLNPYNKLSAGLSTIRLNGVVEGIEHGVNFCGQKDGAIGFENVDFGNFGSDEITLDIFYQSNEPMDIQVWQGKPNEKGSKLLVDGQYDKEPEWMVFKPETYTLKEKLKGVCDVYIASSRGFQLKTVNFKAYNRAYEKLLAIENDKIYGDAFKVNSDAITDIGNNVNIEYKELDFGEKGVRKLIVCGKSSLKNNTLHVRFTDSEGEKIQIIEFAGCKEYTEREFELEEVKGLQDLNLIFLPGSKFDLKWCQFC